MPLSWYVHRIITSSDNEEIIAGEVEFTAHRKDVSVQIARATQEVILSSG